MNTLINVELSTGLLSNNVTHHTLAPLRTEPGAAVLKAAAKSGTWKTKGSRRASSLAKPRLQLGEAVRHSRFGVGQVLAHWPDGTLLVRFDNVAKNQLIWPSFLDRVNGDRR